MAGPPVDPAGGLGFDMVIGKDLPRRRWQGAIIGLIALYAVLLQSFLLSAAPPALPDPTGILCTRHGASPHNEGTPPAVPDHCRHACCTLAQAAALPPPDAAAAVSPQRRPPLLAAHPRPEADLPRTGPPPRAQTARGPPLA